MKFSIIVPVYNGEKYIQETLDSIFTQSYENYEVILMDAVSSDSTLEIAAKYDMLKIISEKDNGQSDAINKGFKIATGDILAWQNADDTYLPNCFEEVADYFQKNPEVSLVYGYYELIDENSKWICDVKPIGWNEWLFKHGRFCPVQPTVFWRRNVYETVGELDTSLNYCMDVDLYARISKRFKVQLLPKVLGKFRVHQESKTQNSYNKSVVRGEYLKVLSRNFHFNITDRMLFNLFQKRADVASVIKRKWLKKQ